ncbi:MAG: hypothetical protein JWP29_1997 [Rhodoferax sp.]|nr:hypothetical protein [Rhodoferax sp.]
MQKDSPHPRPYLRDGVPGLSFDDQEAAMKAADIDISRAYVDRLSKTQCHRRDPASLKDRAEMLKPSRRHEPELIIVASLRVLGWSMADICQSLAAAALRNASVRVLDRGETFDADTMDDALLEALADAEAQRKRGQTATARSAGVEAAAAARRKRREKALAEAKPLWGLPPGEISGAEIAKRVRLSIRLLHKHLGTRADAREVEAKAALRSERKKGKAK